jgi:hypothetical protein
MEPTGIFVGTWVDLSKKKTNVNIMKAMSCAKGGKTRKQTNYTSV